MSIVISDVQRIINIGLPCFSFEDLCFSTGNISDKNYIELDKDTFLEYNVSIPYNMGEKEYDKIAELFENNELDYVRFYNNDL